MTKGIVSQLTDNLDLYIVLFFFLISDTCDVRARVSE